jgi:hypothetical protein
MGAHDQETRSDHELSLAELLGDPMVLALMHADSVTSSDIILLFLKAKARRFGRSASGYAEHEAVASSGDLPIPLVRTAQRSATAPADYAQLGKAAAALKKAKKMLRDAEQRFDRDCGRDPAVLIRQVRTAECDVNAARAALAGLGRRSPG